MFFYTGTSQSNWLWKFPENWFISDKQLRSVRKLAPALSSWALDSGGFTELSLHGAWTISPTAYAHCIRRYEAEIGKLNWAAPQDWLCTEQALARTGKTVLEHQRLTIDSVMTLRQILGSNIVIPVLQGSCPSEYLQHVDMYQRAGFSLQAEPIVGLGSVARQQDEWTAINVIRQLAYSGLKLHVFGFKKTGIAAVGDVIASSDSLSWSYEARRLQRPLPGHTHKNCASCIEYAQAWTFRLKMQFLCITN